MTWIVFTLMAAFMQAWRNALQSQLGKEVKVYGVTLARFLWASPLALLYLCGLYQWHPVHLPEFSATFSLYALGASVMQIVATALMVVLFKQNNYAIGAGLAKTEAVVAAVLGVIFFGTLLTPLGWVGVLVGGVGVFLLSSNGQWRQFSLKTLLLGLACGSSFALTSLWVREASLTLGLPFPHSAAWVLFIVISTQTLLLLTYLTITDPVTLKALWQRPKLTLLTSVTSCIGSIGWFSAMSLQSVPYVKTLGQVEVFFMMLVSWLWLKQKPRLHDSLGLILIAIAAIMVMWF